MVLEQLVALIFPTRVLRTTQIGFACSLGQEHISVPSIAVRQRLKDGSNKD